ncbi:MAG: NAD-dependent epimerase/dehydratase family protein [Bacteroidetes bacterium]|nr:NAD-dependent epimerase/dehydratase family protein [Bacteroidota bacterium]MBU1115436.1 NAD-dependent epimerase/dehydratase family protein [Bacteroidota bacterium]MBU1797579.1 NAD-dependent epimerase/dehydratase family protein [Bacteroidota bacterium]
MITKNISVVTGASGFVGSHLVDYLLEKGDEVHCIVRRSSSLRWLEGKNVVIHDSGLFDFNSLKIILKDIDFLYHVAGVVKAKTEEGYFKGNVETTRNLLDAVLEVAPNIKRVLIVSSLTASGPSKLDFPVDEESIPNPITTYGRSKVAQEELAKKYMDKLPITIVRPPAIYGDRDTEIYLVFKTYKQGLMTLVGFNRKELSIIYVKDLVQGIYLAATSEIAKGETYFISSKEFYNWPQIGKVIKNAMGKGAINLRLPHFLVYIVAAFAQFFSMFSSKPATFNLEKARDFVQEAWTCDTTKAQKDLGFVEKYSLDEGMKATIDWYKKEKWL